MTLQFDSETRNDILDFIADKFDGGTLEIRSGTLGDTGSGVALVTISLPSPAFQSASGGSVSKTGTWQGTAGSDGIASWFRLHNSADDFRIDGDVSATGGGSPLELSSVDVNEGDIIEAVSFSLSLPASS